MSQAFIACAVLFIASCSKHEDETLGRSSQKVGHPSDETGCPEECGDYSCDADFNCYESCQGDLRCGPKARCNLGTQVCEPAFSGACGLYAAGYDDTCYEDCRNDSMCAAGAYCFQSSVCKRDLCSGKQVDDGKSCTADTCDPDIGVVTNAPYTQTVLCSDDNLCNGYGSCNSAGDCTPGTAQPPVITDDDPCTADICEPVSGQITHPPFDVDDGNPCTVDSCDANLGEIHSPVPDGIACDNADKCDGHEVCNGGACGFGSPPIVTDGNACTFDYCDHDTGVHHDARPANFPCPDGNACNGVESCDASAHCLAGVPPTISDDNPCTSDACDPAAGLSHVPLPANSACDDGTLCNGHEYCSVSGNCLAGPLPDLDDHNPCTVDSCDAVLGVTHGPAAVGTSCADSNPCNGAEVCDGNGQCVAGPAVVVDDDNPCTDDSCVAGLGVQHTATALGTACDDATVCNGHEKCDGVKHCAAGTALVVDDGQACTTDSCDPVSGVHHDVAAEGMACSDGNACTSGDACHSGACSPGDPVVCVASDPCHTAVCNSTSGACEQTPKANGVACTSANVCLQNTTCQAGICAGGTPVSLDDHNPCTADACDVVAGPTHVPVTDGVSCADANLCNGDETCQVGTCVAGTAPVLDDGNPCTDDTCLPAQGVQHGATALGVGCDDATVCNGHETCDGAKHCSSGTPLVVEDGKPCTADTCDPVSGVQHQPASEGIACSDGNACTTGDSCHSGECTAGGPVSCVAVDPCHTASCNPSSGSCEQTAKANGTACTSGDACFQNTTCQAGVCEGGTPVSVDDHNPCTTDLCDPATGVAHPAVADGTSCADANLCNGDEICQSGSCANGPPPAVDDNNPCTTDSCSETQGPQHEAVAADVSCDDDTVCNGHEKCDGEKHCVSGTTPVVDDGKPCTADTCDPVSGVHHNAVTEGASCSDGNACSTGDSCHLGECTAGQAVVCLPTDTCRTAACNTSTGQCEQTSKADGIACATLDVCLTNTTCTAGFCSGGTPVSVDDHDPCTTDLCDPTIGPTHTPASYGTSCSDGNLCNGQEICNGSGTCVSGPVLSISDDNPCTEDVCNAAASKIDHIPFAVGTGCDDSTVCNGREICDGQGVCLPGTPEAVDDGNLCTTDSCNAVSGVVHIARAPGVTCDDGTICNGHETCDGNAICVPGSLLVVDDANPCTDDTCDAALGVSHHASTPGTSCSDGNACNGDERCNSDGNCASGAPPAVDDHNPCTQDSCDAGTGVVTNKPVIGGTSCANSNLCDGAETCDGNGVCTPGVALITDDGDSCTADSCDPVLGVKHVRSTANGCTAPGQWQTLIASQPSPRDGAAGVFTSAGELFVYGGENAGASLADGWLWSAAQNGWRRAASGPPARSGSSAAYDSQRQRIMVFGGVSGADAAASYSNDLWEYAPPSNAWLSRSAVGPAPPPRALASFAYDPQSQRGLLFGGVGPTHLSDSWEWNATTGVWTQLGVAGPSARFGGAFAFDPAHHLYVLFGGSPQGVTGGALNDTWTFDANTGLWSQREPSVKPPARAGASMTYDASVSRLVMLGGTSVDILNANDAWEFDAGAGVWTQLGPGTAPAQTGSVAGFDPSTSQLLLATGINFSDSGRFSTDLNTVWTYSRGSQQWSSRSSASAPAKLVLAAAFNPDTGFIVTRAAVDQSDTSTRPMMWNYDGGVRQWYATDASANQTDFSSGAFKEVSNVVNGLIYDSNRHLTLQVTTFPSAWPASLGLVRLREWDGARWKRGCSVQSASASPLDDLGMEKASAIYDPVRKRILLFGSGRVVSLDPAACTVAVQFVDGPRSKESAALGYDSDRDVFVLFGGVRFQEPQADTWEFSPIGNVWTAGGVGPSARSGASMAYDGVRKKLVMYGGAFGSGPARRDTWEYSVTTHSWSQLSAASGPDSVRPWIVFDAKRQQPVLVGTDGSIWTWDGSAWNAELNSIAPSARSGMSGGWDPNLGAGLFFGGTSGDGRRAFLNDLWLWSGGWHQVSAPGNPAPLTWGDGWQSQTATVVSVGPAARTGHVLASGYGDSSDAALLFGGEGDSGLFGDTWTLDESSLQWLFRPAPTTFSDPIARTGHAATLFPGKGYLMFGGLARTSGGQDTLLNDTWAWMNGWSQVFNTAPSARFAHAMATDELGNKVILFGGRDASGVLGDTWLLDLNTLQSTGWQKLNPPNAPKARFGHAMSYDSVRQRIVLTGGEGALPGTAFGDTWEWDSAALNWSKRNVGAMDGRAGQIAFFDKKQSQTIVFGGLAHDASGQVARTYGDTLAFTGASQIDPIALKDNGDNCTAGGACASGLCVDGVCCNTTCSGQCAACNMPGLEGTCSPSTGIPHGSRPSCGGSGGSCGARCDGSDTTACHPAPSGTSCGAGVGCNNGSLTQGPGVCDGAGACSQAATSCLPYMCFGPPDLPTAQCMTSCQTDGYCFSADYRCSRPGGQCYLAAKLAPNGVSVAPTAPKVGTTMTIAVQPLVPGSNYLYTYRIITQAGSFRFPCQLTTSTSCPYTPVAADLGAASITVSAQAPQAQSGSDTSQTITTTIGAAQ